MMRAPRVIQALDNMKSVKEVFTIDGFLEGLTPLAALVVDNGQGKQHKSLYKQLNCESVINADCPDELAIDPMSTAVLMYSSGTTGVPKAIVHTYRNFASSIEYYG